MRRFLEPILLTLIIFLAGWLEVGWVSVWPIGGSGFNVIIAVVIAVALFRPWSSALWAALVAGFYLSQYTVWPWFVYPIAMLGMVSALRFVVRRWIAAKSSASLITAISVATAVYYAALAGQVEIYRLVTPSLLKIGWPEVIFMTAIQCVIHPIIIYFIWRRLTGGSFSLAVSTEGNQQPF